MNMIINGILGLLFLATFQNANDEEMHKNRPDFSEYTYYSPKPHVESECFKCRTNDKAMCKHAEWHTNYEEAGKYVYICTPENKCKTKRLKKGTWLDYFVWKYDENVCSKME